MGRQFIVYGGAMQTTAAAATQATGAVIKTLIQITPNATAPGIKIKEWGISFDGITAATPIKVELIETGTVAATVTAFVANDITKVNGPGDEASTIQLGTALSGFNASAEGTVTAVRNLDGPKLVAPTNQYEKQFPLGDEPYVGIGKMCRIRVTAPAGVNCYPYIKFEE